MASDDDSASSEAGGKALIVDAARARFLDAVLVAGAACLEPITLPEAKRISVADR